MKTVILTLALVATGLSAQTLKEVKLDVAQVQVGQNVTALVGVEISNNANCGLRVRWGDGTDSEIRVQDKNVTRYEAIHSYTKPGDYTVTADPGKVKSSLGCMGKNVTTTLKVVAVPAPPPAPVAAVPAAPAAPVAVAAAAPSCPEGWKLDAKTVVKKTGAYGCTAKPGTALPEKNPACPGDLTYYENGKKGMLGCRP